MSSSAGTTGGYEIIHTSRQVSKQDIVFHKPDGIFLVHQAGRRIAGIRSVRECALFSPVPAGDIDIPFGGISGTGCLVGLRGIACSAGVDNDRGGSRRIDLPIGAGDGSVIIDHQISGCAAACYICRTVSVRI